MLAFKYDQGASGRSYVQSDPIGLGTREEGTIFRGFHQNTCFEIGIQFRYSALIDDPKANKQFFEVGLPNVKLRLEQAVGTFQFLN